MPQILFTRSQVMHRFHFRNWHPHLFYVYLLSECKNKRFHLVVCSLTVPGISKWMVQKEILSMTAIMNLFNYTNMTCKYNYYTNIAWKYNFPSFIWQHGTVAFQNGWVSKRKKLYFKIRKSFIDNRRSETFPNLPITTPEVGKDWCLNAMEKANDTIRLGLPYIIQFPETCEIKLVCKKKSN